MARLVGIDIRRSHVRAVLLRTSYRSVTIENLQEIDVSAVQTLEQAVRAAALPLCQHGEAVAVSVDGEATFVHRLRLPLTAIKQIDEVLPFELEAAVPVDLDELVRDYRLLRAVAGEDTRSVLVGAARQAHVQELIGTVREALGREPERVGCGPIPLANLASVSNALSTPAPIALVDLGGNRTEVVVLSGGEAVYARTLSRGVEGLPESAPALAAALRQTVTAWIAQGGDPLQAIYLLGGGAAAPGAEAYLTSELGVVVQGLHQLDVDLADPNQAEHVPRFAKAISLALGLGSRPRDLDLRTGALSYQRGFGFLKEKVPLLAGLGTAIAISFMFATWAEYRALSAEQEVLSSALAKLSKEILGEETTDAARVQELISGGGRKSDADPLPRMDGFDVMVEVSKAVPMSMTHDIEELDMQRRHVKMHAIVGATDEAQSIAGALKAHRCFGDLKISKITKAINSDRQKYVLEFDAQCPEEKKGKKKKDGSKEDKK